MAGPATTFDADETRRYARQLVLKGFGGAGQQRLKAARILVVGAGALGSPVIAYLAAAGTGTLGIADFDRVALSNLHRQIVHRSDGLQVPKTESAAVFVAALNPHVRVVEHMGRVEAATGAALMAGYDVVIDGTDGIDSRRAVAAAAETARKPLVTGAVMMFDGQLTVLAPHASDPEGAPAPRFADLYPDELGPEDVPSCEQVGVMGAVAGVVGTLMAMEAIKLVTGIGDPLVGRLLLYDGRAARFTEISYRRGG